MTSQGDALPSDVDLLYNGTMVLVGPLRQALLTCLSGTIWSDI